MNKVMLELSHMMASQVHIALRAERARVAGARDAAKTEKAREAYGLRVLVMDDLLSVIGEAISQSQRPQAAVPEQP